MDQGTSRVDSKSSRGLCLDMTTYETSQNQSRGLSLYLDRSTLETGEGDNGGLLLLLWTDEAILPSRVGDRERYLAGSAYRDEGQA